MSISLCDFLQTFIRVFNVKSNQEVTFTADSDSSDVYKFTLDIAESGKDFFNQQSGKYTVDLIVGDAIIQNPFIWNVVRVTEILGSKETLSLVWEEGTNWNPGDKEARGLGVVQFFS